jgi:hypothetical protein
MDRFYGIDTTTVVSDIIDGEAVMLHRVSGDYFSTNGVGCLIWQWIGEGKSRSRIIAMLNGSFVADPLEVSTAVDSFLADLVTHRLVREISDGVELAAQASIEPEASLESGFTRPVLHVYSDIRKLLLLDPVHDVADESGWPERKRTDPAA